MDQPSSSFCGQVLEDDGKITGAMAEMIATATHHGINSLNDGQWD